MPINRQIRLARRPVGMATKADFSFTESPVHPVLEGKALVENIYLSLDPTIRGWMNEWDTYMPAIKLNDVMRGITVGIVRESRCEAFKVGDIVTGLHGWQNFAEIDAGNATLVPASARNNLPAVLSIFGLTGLTAYFGLLDVGQPKAGETVVVSGAYGAVGSIVGQIAKIKGCRAVGIAGSKEKCEKLVQDLGFDAAVDYKSDNFLAELQNACPNGVDVYFDNTAGPILDAVLGCINLKARIAFCGAISTYNAKELLPGPYNYFQLIVKRAKVEGFLFSDYIHRTPEAIRDLSQWIGEGKLRYEVDIVEGLENAPEALNKLFDGTNKGKLLVRLAHDS